MQRILQPGEIEALDGISFPRIILPQPAMLFQDRAARLLQLAEGNPIADYLRFTAQLVLAQQQVCKDLPTPKPLSKTSIEQANANGMPLLSKAEALPSTWPQTLRRLVDTLIATHQQSTAEKPSALPPSLIPALQQLHAKNDEALIALAKQVLADNVGRDELATAPIVMASLQVQFAHIAAHIPEQAVPYAEPAAICPICGSAPVASVLRIGARVAGHRYLHCSLCCSEWHMVRVKCSHCESTKGISYQGIQGQEGKTDSQGKEVKDQVVLAETCDECHTYRKLVNQEKSPYAEPLADDLATLMLDLLMGETDFVRASDNPLLLIEKPLAV
ncbi:formate dehydrogenase accessory protein FdhE [Lampropedia puyangensis]|uniref:Protein FdhE homolog n=1 Tax=Lampropedia puyangensis TaxID=1330072 RepID=A0A4S8FB78_9BURK|nr:formate dehydrogenase accessory protein FdhE [Lampropedia puyangensis]THU04537.1 formate dehydrogenase accessory protein FdhE [Lampropedia puyangensis]